jgi:hypothetical protein
VGGCQVKAVIYHANAKRASKIGHGVYETLIAGLRKNVNGFGMPLVHLTLNGHDGMGDENYWFPGEPEDIVFNREKIFTEFLTHAPDDVYWLTEPDSRIAEPIPELTTDLALLRRQDNVAITPAWRLCTKAALPFFHEMLECYPRDKRGWDGDSDAWIEMWQRMGRPDIGVTQYRGISIELRDYRDYCTQNARYTRQWKAHHKITLLNKER